MADCKTRISLIPLPQFQADKGPLPDGMLSAGAAFSAGIPPGRDRRFRHRACFPRDRGGHSRRTR